MKKLLSSIIVVMFALSIVSCVNLTKEQNSSNAPKHEQASPATGEKTTILKGKDLKGAQITAFDEQGRKLTFQLGYKPWKTFQGKSLRDFLRAAVRLALSNEMSDLTAAQLFRS